MNTRETLNIPPSYNNQLTNIPVLSKSIHSTNIASRVTSSVVLGEAFEYIYASRKEDSHNSDIWQVRANWIRYKNQIQSDLLGGNYQLLPVDVYANDKGERYSRWSSKDAIVLKAISIVIDREVLQKTGRVHHLKGQSVSKGAVRNISKQVTGYRYVVKSDVADFYGSMNHEILLDECRKIIKDKRIIKIIRQYINRLEICMGQYEIITRGICRGYSLSPIMGAIILKSLNSEVGSEYCYARYMDDWIVLAKTRWQVRKVVRLMHQVMARLQFKLAVVKTYVGKISKGFEFLGCRIEGQVIIGLARKAIDNLVKLYEQSACLGRIDDYMNKWCVWACSGIVPNFKIINKENY